MTLAGLSPAGVLLVRAGEPMVLRVTLARADGTPQDLTGRTFAGAFRRSRTTTPFLTVAAELSGDALSMMVPITATEASLIHGIGATEAVSYDIVELSGNASVSRWTARVSVDVGPEFPTDEVPVWIDLPYSEATVLPSALVVIERGAIGPGTEERLLLIGKISEATPEAMEAYFVGLGEEGARPFAEAAAASEEVALAKAGEASASALAAGLSASAADGAAGRAAVSADFAATMVAGSIKQTVAQGLAETTNGQRFTAYGPGLAFATLYLNNAGVAVPERTFASQEAMDAWQQSVRKDVDVVDRKALLPKATARIRGTYPLIEQQHGAAPLNIDGFGRTIGREFITQVNPEQVTIRHGIAVTERDMIGRPVRWIDYRRRMVRTADDIWDQPVRARGVSSFMLTAGTDVPFAIGPDGAVMEPASARAHVTYPKPVDDSAGAIQPVSQIYVVIGAGNAPMRVTAGIVNCYAPKVIAPGLIKYGKEDGTTAVARYFVNTIIPRTKRQLYLLHGQSTAMATSDPLIPVRLPYNPDPAILMFNGGVRAAARNNIYDPSLFTSVVPAFEQFGPPANSTRGDTGMVALAHTLRQAVAATMHLSVSGQGGTAFQDLGPGTQYWANMLYGVQRAKYFADLASESIEVPFFYFRQGENNVLDTWAEYLARLTSVLAPAVHADIPALTGQTVPPLIVLQQISYCPGPDASGYYGLFGPGEAQARAGLEDSRFITACPQYIAELIDTYHFPAIGSVWMASFAAKAIRRHLYQGMPWKPLHMARCERHGRKIYVEFAGGWLDYGGQLTVDTSWVTDPGALGFAYTDDTNSAKVVSARQTGKREFTVLMDSNQPGVNGKLGIAQWAPWRTSGTLQAGPKTGLRSPIRDNDPEHCLITGRPGHNYPISHNRGV